MIASMTDVDGVAVATLPVDVDAANSTQLREELSGSVPHGSRDLVIDLGGTRYLDSAGIDMLFRLAQRLSERRAALRVVIPADSRLRRLAEIVGLDGAMVIHMRLADAVGAARAEQMPRDAPQPSSSPPSAWPGNTCSEGSGEPAGSQGI